MSGTADYAYGVQYTPDGIKASSQNVHSLAEHSLTNEYLLDRLGIKYIRIQWLDLTNATRFRILPREYMSKILKSSRPGVTLVTQALGMVGLTIAPGFPATGEYIYIVDPSSFRVCPYAPGHASVMGFFQEKIPNPQWGLEVPLCPRTLLKRIVDDAEKQAGIAFLVGVESEFILLKDWSLESGKLVEANDADWSASAKFPTAAPETVILEEIADAIIGARIELQMFHAEAAPGQYEVITGPLDPLAAADALVFTREAIRNIAAKYGYRASFAPRLHLDSCGSGAHVHVSVHSTRPSAVDHSQRTGENLAPTLTAAERSFLQGLLTHLPSICALSLPTSASYLRVHDGIWTGGTYAVWGSDNRETPVRLCGSPSSPSGGGHHFEIRNVDATACMYVALAGLLGAGTLAIKENTQLALGDCQKAVAQMSDDERTQYFRGAKEGRLPRSIEEARELLGKNAILIEKVLGSEFVEKYLSVNKTLQAALTGNGVEDEIKKLLRFY